MDFFNFFLTHRDELLKKYTATSFPGHMVTF